MNKSAAMIGAGLIGRAWAMVFARAGWTVRLYDSHPAQLANARNYIAASLAEQEAAGWVREREFEIPHGPCCSFTTPGGHRVALYQLIRPEVAAHFDGRRDF